MGLHGRALQDTRGSVVDPGRTRRDSTGPALRMTRPWGAHAAGGVVWLGVGPAVPSGAGVRVMNANTAAMIATTDTPHGSQAGKLLVERAGVVGASRNNSPESISFLKSSNSLRKSSAV